MLRSDLGSVWRTPSRTDRRAPVGRPVGPTACKDVSGRLPAATLLLMASFFALWLMPDVCGSRLVLAHDWHTGLSVGWPA
jgi:hypothetical protein